MSLQINSVGFLETGIETFRETGCTTINKTEKSPFPPGTYVLGQGPINKPLLQRVGSVMIQKNQVKYSRNSLTQTRSSRNFPEENGTLVSS